MKLKKPEEVKVEDSSFNIILKEAENLQSKIDNEVNLFLNPELLRTLLSNKAALMSSNILPTRVNYGFKSSPSGFLKRYMNYLSGKPHDKDRDLRDNPDGTWSNVVYLVDAWEYSLWVDA